MFSYKNVVKSSGFITDVEVNFLWLDILLFIRMKIMYMSRLRIPWIGQKGSDLSKKMSKMIGE